MDAGANLIITQLFYDVGVFLSFVQSCRDAGIQVPIVPGTDATQMNHASSRHCSQVRATQAPTIAAHAWLPGLAGIMPLGTYAGFRRMTGFCKTRIPPSMEKRISFLEQDDEGVLHRCLSVYLLFVLSHQISLFCIVINRSIDTSTTHT